MERLTQGFTVGTRIVLPTVPVVDDQHFTVGGLSFHILAPPRAHSGTDIMIHVPETGVLFLGDNVMNGRFGRMDEGNFQGNIAACDRARAVPSAQTFVPGHGQTGPREIIGSYRDYLSTLLETVRSEHEKGRQDYEMKPIVRAKLARFVDWVGFDLNFGRHLSVAVLEIEAM
jgi:glyoxylase-like metal-dependent hydrolase (beta-lactamase superfamily II)